MKITWTAGVNDVKEKEELEQRIHQCRDVLDRLHDMLDLKFTDTRKADYKDPSWSHEQADKIGYNRALTEVQNLINLEEK